jgi:HlyD family secretion protein
MPSEIYRKVSLDRLSSPEQLDQLLIVATPKNWVALFAFGAALTAGIVWGIFGSSDTTVSGQGVIVRRGGVLNVVSLAGGRITQIKVRVGDHVSAGQVIAQLAQPDLVEKLKNSNEELQEAESAKQRQAAVNTDGERSKQAATAKQREAMEQEISDTREQIKYAKEQIPVDDQLVEKGLITRQTAIQDQQKLATLQQNVAKLEAQLAQLQSDELGTLHQDAQTLLQHTNKISDLRRTRRLLEENMAQSITVTSPNEGRVVELKTYAGAIVAAGAPIVSIEPEIKSLEAVAYIPSDHVKEINPGMDVHISPSGVEREEYGYMLGHVSSVGDFPATSEAIVNNFQNDALAKSMLGGGPVTELRVNFLPDPKTRSGFAWSSSTGPAMSISSGSVCGVDVVTRKQHPIALLFPYMKKKLGFQ